MEISVYQLHSVQSVRRHSQCKVIQLEAAILFHTVLLTLDMVSQYSL